MDYSELEASAETELREAILSEFLKPELPAPITLLRHCERYTVRIFDAQAERLFDKGPRPDDYWRCLRNVMENLLVYFFGCPYEPPSAAHITRRSLGDKQAMIGGTRVAPGCPWGRCIEYAMLARVDHGPEPRPGEDEILGRYLDINGHFFLTYALQTRVDFWHSKAQSADLISKGAAEGGFPRANEAGATAPSGDESTRTEAGPAVNAAIPNSKGQGRRCGPRPDYETAGRVAEVIARVAPDGCWRSNLDEVLMALDDAQIPTPKTWLVKHDYRNWYAAVAGDKAGRGRHMAIEAIKHHLKRAKEKPTETIP